MKSLPHPLMVKKLSERQIHQLMDIVLQYIIKKRDLQSNKNIV